MRVMVIVKANRDSEAGAPFLTAELTIAQRIARGKQTLAESRVPFEVARDMDRAARLSSVLEVIYLIFNEGYSTTMSEDWMRPALCEEALRWARLSRGPNTRFRTRCLNLHQRNQTVHLCFAGRKLSQDPTREQSPSRASTRVRSESRGLAKGGVLHQQRHDSGQKEGTLRIERNRAKPLEWLTRTVRLAKIKGETIQTIKPRG